VAFWPTSTVAGPLGKATAGVLVDDPVIGITGAGVGVAAAQADKTKARMVRLTNKSLVFIGSSDQISRHTSARWYGLLWVYNIGARPVATRSKVVKSCATLVPSLATKVALPFIGEGDEIVT
jgi:hypothetical protein